MPYLGQGFGGSTFSRIGTLVSGLGGDGGGGGGGGDGLGGFLWGITIAPLAGRVTHGVFL